METSTHFLENLKKKVAKENHSVSQIERNAGLKPSTLRNILLGRSKNPTIDVISKLADEFDCSVDELINPNNKQPKDQSNVLIHNFSKALAVNWKAKLMEESIKYVNNYIHSKRLKLPANKIFSYILQIYNYSYQEQAKNNAIDQKFAKWLLDNQTKKIKNEL